MLGSVVGSGISSYAGAEANNDAIGKLEGSMRRDDAEYRRLLGRDYVDSPENAGLLRRLQEMQRERYNQARATNVVAGGTDAHLAAMQTAGDKVVSDTANSVSQRAQAAKDALRSERRQVKRGYAQQMFGLGQQRAQSIAQAGGQLSKAMSGIAGAAGTVENPYDMFGLDQQTYEDAAKAAIDATTEASVEKQLEDSLQETLDDLKKQGY